MSLHTGLNFKIAMSRVRFRWLKSNLPPNLEAQLIRIKTLAESKWKRIHKGQINLLCLLLPKLIMFHYRAIDTKSLRMMISLLIK
jgi:hypothetical protein